MPRFHCHFKLKYNNEVNYAIVDYWNFSALFIILKVHGREMKVVYKIIYVYYALIDKLFTYRKPILSKGTMKLAIDFFYGSN